MKNIKAFSLPLTLITIFFLCGCGQTGPLTLPPEKAQTYGPF